MNCLESMVRLLRPVGVYSLREDSLVYAELCGYYEGLRIIEDELALLAREGFLCTAREFGLTEWERIIRSAAFESASLEDRRQVVLYTLSRMPSDFNREGMLRGLSSLGLDCTLEEDCASGTVTVTVNGYTGMLRTYEEVLARVQNILPAHIGVVLDIGVVTWEALDLLDHSFDMRDILDMTWDAFELTKP